MDHITTVTNLHGYYTPEYQTTMLKCENIQIHVSSKICDPQVVTLNQIRFITFFLSTEFDKNDQMFLFKIVSFTFCSMNTSYTSLSNIHLEKPTSKGTNTILFHLLQDLVQVV